MTIPLTAGVHRLGDSTVNFYVLREGTDLTLVDTGLPAHYAQLSALLADNRRSVRDIRAVLLTPAHLDHIGLAERIRRETAATAWVHQPPGPAATAPLPPARDARPEGHRAGYAA